jgi:hypothetical protein
MNRTRTAGHSPVAPCAALLAAVLGLGAAPAGAADEHAAHQAAGAASAPGDAADAGMAAMKQMHEKMMKAPAQERRALMAEHMKTMRGGMEMMKRMSGQAQKEHQHGQDGGKEAPPAGPDRSAGAQARQQMIEQRLDMMQMLLEMMMDQLQARPGAN